MPLSSSANQESIQAFFLAEFSKWRLRFDLVLADQLVLRLSAPDNSSTTIILPDNWHLHWLWLTAIVRCAFRVFGIAVKLVAFSTGKGWGHFARGQRVS